MSEIQIVSNAGIIQYLFGAIVILIGVVNALGAFILRGIKISIDQGEIKRQVDHDLLKIMVAEHRIFCPKSNINQNDA